MASDDTDYIPADPPVPGNISPEVRFQIDMLRWQTNVLVEQLRANARTATAERAEVASRLDDHEIAGKARFGQLLAAINAGQKPLPAAVIPEGPLSKLIDRLGALPQPVQIGLVVVLAQILLQLSGVAYAKVVGAPPPQVTVPVNVLPIATPDVPDTVGSTP